MRKAFPIMLAVAALLVGAPARLGFAQDVAAGGAQANDPEKAATDAYTAWKAETDPEKKFQAGKAIVSQYPGTKASEAVAYAYLFDQKPDQTTVTRKYEVSKAYYDAGVGASKDGTYAEYALGNLATIEKDPAKAMEYGRTYLQKYPSGKFVEYVKTAMAAARYQAFTTAIKATPPRYNDAITTANEAFAANENEFAYAYVLAASGLTDEAANGAKSQFVGKVSAWADRGIQYLESGKMPPGTDQAKWNADKPKSLATLYKAKGIDTYLKIASSNPTTADAIQPAIDALKAAIAKNAKDAALEYFLAQAYTSPYTIYSTQYTALDDTAKGADPGKALLDKVNNAADMVIDSYIRAIAFSPGGENSPLAAQIKPQLEELWKFRHPDAPTAWHDEVNKVTNGAPTASSGK